MYNCIYVINDWIDFTQHSNKAKLITIRKPTASYCNIEIIIKFYLKFFAEHIGSQVHPCTGIVCTYSYCIHIESSVTSITHIHFMQEHGISITSV